MKKFALILAPMLFLTACASTGVATNDATINAVSTAATTISNGGTLQSASKTLVTQMADSQCRSQLNAQQYYKAVATFMTSDQKTALEDKVCGCVSEEATNSVSMSDIVSAGLNKDAQTQVVGKAVAKTLQTCAMKFISN